jgi:hypothetical protein
MQQVDARLNEWQGSLDAINGITLTDPRTAVNTLASNNAEVLVDLNGKSSLFIDVRCSVTFNAATNLVVEGTIDGTNYFTLPFFFAQSNDETNFRSESMSNVLGGANITAGDVFALCCSVTGFRRARVRMNFTTAGTATVALRATEADYRIIAQPQPTGLVLTSTNAASAALALVVPAPPAGLFNYLTSIHISHAAAAAITAAAAGTITVTNMGIAGATTRWMFPNTGAIGAYTIVANQTFSTPVKCFAAASAFTFASSVPTTGGHLMATVSYYVGA